nr:hypothetical protein [Silicimonas algicola]
MGRPPGRSDQPDHDDKRYDRVDRDIEAPSPRGDQQVAQYPAVGQEMRSDENGEDGNEIEPPGNGIPVPLCLSPKAVRISQALLLQ